MAGVAERRTGRAGGLIALATVAALLPGCAGIPTDSPVEAATPGEGDGRSDVRIEAQPPQTGATPTQIVEGFLDAMSSYQLGFPLAEEFLTPDARDGWGRDAIDVYNSTTLEETQPGLVELVADPAARIDGAGRFSAAAPTSAPLIHTFRLALVEVDERGEWRIVNPPNVLLISSFDLSRTYSPFVTYFPDPSGQVLVPDRVWLPAAEPQLATLLAQAVVDGPTDLIGPRGVANPFPPDTVVTGGAISGGRTVVTVALPAPPIGESDGAARRLMVAQLADTLTQLPQVEVVLTLGGQVVDVSDASGALAALAGFSDPPAYVLTEDNAVLVADPTRASDLVPVAGPLGRGEVPCKSLAVSLDRTVAATVDETGTQVLRTSLTEDGTPVLVYQGEDVGPLSFDRYGNLWLVDRRSGGRASEVKLVQPDGTVVTVAAPDLAGLRVIDLRVAVDGVRVAVVTEGPTGGLRLGHVVRGAAPELALTVALPFDGTVTDVAWAGPTELLVVATPPGGLPRPYTVSIDGATVTEGSVTGITAVAAYATRLAFARTDASNVLRQTSVLQWDQVTTGKSVTYPG